MSWFVCWVLGHGTQWNDKGKDECPICKNYEEEE